MLQTVFCPAPVEPVMAFVCTSLRISPAFAKGNNPNSMAVAKHPGLAINCADFIASGSVPAVRKQMRFLRLLHGNLATNL